ncbi:45119_t:CDS:1, partial [Gigaspora margarita]
NYDLDEEEGTMWEDIDLLKLIDLENSIFQNTDNQKMIENSDDEDKTDLNDFIQDLEDQKDYNP